MITKWKLEDDVNDFVKKQFELMGLKKNIDYGVESSMSDYMKKALDGSAKTKKKTNFGKPDFHLEKYLSPIVPVVIECKLHSNKLIASTKNGIKMDARSVANYAVNGAVYYAQNMIASDKYSDAVAIGIAGDSEDDVKISVYYVFGSAAEPKYMGDYQTLDFLESNSSFIEFYNDATLTDKEKHQILIESQQQLQKHANNLNVLMNNHSITVEQRVVYISGMLLAMQDVVDKTGKKIDEGLTTDDLKGSQIATKRDGILIVNQIEAYLTNKGVPNEKKDLMLDIFKGSISLDSDRDKKTELKTQVSTLLNENSSVNKQVFAYIYENVFLAIDGTAGHLDIMGEMYSVFLKYALGDGKEIGIVLTPPYITKMMAEILDVNKDSYVMDLATGSAGFLISSMETMIQDAELSFGKKTHRANVKIKEIKEKQLLGIELDAKMYVLAATNMILRGDGSSNIQKGSSFNKPESLYEQFSADRLLLNPPFTYVENGMPFMAHGLRNMRKGGKAAIIIQDSAGRGKATKTNKEILKHNTLIASIKMPEDTFKPSADVQTSIYIFEAGKPHDFNNQLVKFIDFRNDGYKRTKRNIKEIDHPKERYQDIIKIFKLGLNAEKNPDFHSDLWNIKDIYVEDLIDDSGNDWNFEKHQIIDNTPDEEDFLLVVSDYIDFKVNNLRKGR